ncbi:hypothetical protein [Aestuariivirga sp.]|uniref:hypothetical protein n=1 Tax=Aestuariivirga sp. TaxID=2650926 RepID=UPI0025BCF354|nr:hypothetical protein [Aestuariivirga sp.]MCA3555207.1 hypothetical protein [Aestuariivirga sp.]
MPAWVEDALNLSGTLFLLRFHWFWMLVSLGLGAWVGWRMAGEPPDTPLDPEDGSS